MDKNKLHQKFVKVLYTLLFLLLTLIFVSSKGNAQIIVNVVEDTYTDEVFKNSNYGNEEYLQVGISGGINHYTSYLQFDFSDFKGYLLNHELEITKFDLCFYPYYFSVSNITNFNLTFIALDKAFDENIITYNSDYRQYWINDKNISYNLLNSELDSFVCFDIRGLVINNVDDYFKFAILTNDNDGEHLLIRAKEYGSSYAYIEAEYERKSLDISAYNLSEFTNVVFLFVLIFSWLGVMALGFTFKNGGFVAFGFFIGIILGFMLSGFHIFLTLLFMLMNITIFYTFVKKS